MDNLNKIKYKKSVGTLIKKIDVATGKVMAEFDTARPERYAGYLKEMQAWLDAGNEIEPQYTESELAEKEEKENIQALENQKSICKNLLDTSEIHVSNDPPYPDDVEAWKTARKEWRKILKSDILQEIYPKPF